MKVVKILAFAILLSFFNSNLNSMITKKDETIKTLLIDCSGSQSYKYDPFIQISESVGFKFDYKPLEQVLDNSDNFDLNKYKAAFFILGIPFLKNAGKNLASNQILNLISRFYNNANVTIGLIIPTIGSGQGNKVSILFPLFARMGLLNRIRAFNKMQVQSGNGVNLFLNAVNNFLNVPLESRPLSYDTSLKLPVGYMLNIDAAFSKLKFPVLPLPQNKDFSNVIKNTLPYAIYYFDQERNNNIFITSTTLISFSGISESFQFCPEDFGLRLKIHKAVQQTLFEFKKLIKSDDKKNVLVSNIKSPSLPNSVSKVGFTKWDKIEKDFFKKIGWMELNSFEEPLRKKDQTDKSFADVKNERKLQQPILIDDIYSSGLDALWITINPHMYYSPIGVRKGFEDRFLKSVGLFTKSLKQKAKELKVKVPKLLLGYEIANNIYSPNLPKNYSVDLYGNEYKDLPSSLDKNFWNDEIKKPLITFLQKWNDANIGNGLAISGVVLDLEMYMRKQSGAFLNTMGFENSLIFEFNNQDLQSILKNRQVEQYYKFLQKGAEQVGQDLRTFFDEKIPNCFIACYAPNISIDWFYKNFYKGLCDKNKTIQLMTFNVEFASHQNWLKNNGINASHASVLMLSKLKGQQSFKWVDHILKHNYGLWLNRFSRFPEKFNRSSWISIEQTPMNEKDKDLFFDYLRAK